MIFRPPGPDELAEWLAARERSVPLLITGSGDSACPRARAEAEGTDLVGMEYLDGPVDYRPEDLTVTVGAGMRVSRLASLVENRGQWLPAGAEARARSVGGWIAAAPPGPFDHAFGPIGRQLLACRVQALDGRRYRWGRSVVKNVAGYSMVRLMCGSRGRLGVLTEACLRVWPRPQTSVRCHITGGPELVGRLAAEGAAAPIGDPEGAVWEARGEGEGRLTVWLHGSERSTSTRAAALERWALDLGHPFECSPDKVYGTADVQPERRIETTSLRLTTGRRYVVEGIRRVRETFGRNVRRIDALPALGIVRFQLERADHHDSDVFAPLLGPNPALGPGLVERGGEVDLAAEERRRAAAIRRTETGIIAALGGQRRHWLGDYL